MALSTLLNLSINDRSISAFDFEHDMHHRALAEKTATNSYVFDPPYDTHIPASGWHYNHQQMHNNFTAALPFSRNQNLKENNLVNDRNRTWWTFINHQDHLIANAALVS